MRFEVGDMVRMAWHDTNWPGVVEGRLGPYVHIWWPKTNTLARLRHNDGDLILYAKGTIL